MAKVSQEIPVKKLKIGKGGLTAKQRALAQVVIEAMQKGQVLPKAELLRRAEYSESVVQRGASNNEGAPWTSDAFKKSLQDSGFTVDRLSEIHEDASKANIVAVYQGAVTETNVPDHALRLKAAKQVAEYTGVAVKRTQAVTVNVDANGREALDLLGLG